MTHTIRRPSRSLDSALTLKLLPLTLLAFGIAACGGDAGEDPDADHADAIEEMPFDVSTAGHVEGLVSFEGTPPAPEPIDMSSEQACAEKYDEDPTREWVKVRDGSLADVFIYVREGLEDMTFPAPAEATVIDQDGCRYHPHVTGVQVNQTLTFTNSDGVFHNVNATPSENRPFNFGQPGAVQETSRTLSQPEIMVPIECDAHGWMAAFVGVVAHPYHSASGEDGGFDLRDLPPGEYVIEAWHSRLGTQTQSVTVTTGETAEIAFVFDEGMLATADVPMGAPLDPHNHGDTPAIGSRVGSTTPSHTHPATGTDRR